MSNRILTGYRILVTEDDPDLLEITGDYLELNGALVFRAENGLRGLDVLMRERVDLILSDYRMPECNGKVFLSMVRERHPKDPKFLFLTGFSDITATEAIALGANGVLHKPMKFDELVRAIDTLRNSTAITQDGKKAS